MNTRKLFFGFLAVAFLAMTAVSTITLNDDASSTLVDKDKVVILK